MIYTDLTKRAMKLCFEAHKDQVDKAGIPYIFHPIHVAEQMGSEETTAAALLHDLVEDTPHTLEELDAMGFPPSVLHLLQLLTHDPGEPYMEYVCRLGCVPGAKEVKLADLTHNSDLSRLDTVTEDDLRRRDKYRMAKRVLAGCRCGGEGSACTSKLWLGPDKNVILSLSATEDLFLGYSLDIPSEWLSLELNQEDACRLNTLLGAGISLPENIENYLRQNSAAALAERVRTYIGG